MGKNKKKSLKSFSIAEAMITLLIVSVAIAAMAPIMSKKSVPPAGIQKIDFPIGGIMIWGTSARALPDDSWLPCDGRSIPSGGEYERLRLLYGSNVPNYNGMFLRGTGNQKINNVTYSGNAIGLTQGDTIRAANVNLRGSLDNGSRNTDSSTFNDNHYHISGSTTFAGSYGGTHAQNLQMGGGGWTTYHAFTSPPQYPSGSGGTSHFHSYSVGGWGLNVPYNNSTLYPTSTEVRPANVSVSYIIKAK